MVTPAEPAPKTYQDVCARHELERDVTLDDDKKRAAPGTVELSRKALGNRRRWPQCKHIKRAPTLRGG